MANYRFLYLGLRVLENTKHTQIVILAEDEFMEDEDNGVESAEQIYKSVLYCNNEYVLGGTTF